MNGLHDPAALQKPTILLGIDVGTTGTKTIALTPEGKLLGKAYRGYETLRPQMGYAEQDPAALWNAVVETVREALGGAAAAEARVGISLSAQGGTLIPADAAGQPLCNAVLWTDRRCAAQRKRLAKSIAPQAIYETTGWTLGNGLNALQILWYRENKPLLFAQTAMFLSVPDYITWKLTGRYAIDYSGGGINQLEDIRRGCWDGALLEALGITQEQLSPLCPSGALIGTLCPNAAETLGLSPAAKVFAGGHDQYCVALGAGAFQSGDVMIGTGTAWVATGIFDKPSFDLQKGIAQSRHTVSGLWGRLLSMGTGGDCLEWLRKSLQLTDRQNQPISFPQLDREVAQKPIGANGLLFYPYFGGSSYPVRCQEAKAAFVGLDLSHDRFDLARAVMEGVAFQIVWTLDAFGEGNRGPLKLVGGAANSGLWVQMVADIANRPVVIPETPDMACMGAAMLAGMGLEVFPSAQAACQALASGERQVLPLPDHVAAYAARFACYKAHFQDICHCCEERTELDELI